MRIIIKELILMMIILLFQATFLHDLGYSQSHEKKQSLNNDVVPDEVVERLRGIYEKGLFSARSFRAKWNPDGSGYLVLENLPGNDEQALVSYEAESGNRSVLITSSQLDLPGKTGRLLIESYVFSSDGKRILLKAGHEDRGDTNPGYWMLETKTGAIQSVTAGNNSRISPEGQRLLYADQGNLYVSDVTRDQTTQLTRDAMEGKVWNGRAVWSPSEKRIAYIQTDASDVKVRSSLVPGDPSYPEIRETRFARAGGTINSLRLAVIDSEGKEQRWLPIPIPAEGFYLGQVSWAGNSNELLVERLSRFRDKREFFLVDVNSGKATIIYEESDPAWVVASYRKNSGLSWIRDFSAFIVLSEKDGWRHAYVCSRDGQSQDLLTPGEFDIIERVKVDEEKGWFYYNASPDNGTQKYLYRVKLKGNGKAERVTPMDQPGTHNYAVSPDAKWAFHTYSSRDTPHITELVKLPEHKVVRVLEDNKVLRNRMDSLQVQAKEFLQLDIGNGIVMDAWMIKPKDFNPSGKYPVLVYVYGEPHAQTVLDVWGHAMTEYHRVIADLGYLVLSIDNRGTPCPKGAAWRRAISGSLGPLSTEEQAAGIEELGRTRPYVDLSRVGIWGWSGGGSNTLNAMFRKPDVYHVGIAVAPKPQPHLYNAWFQEIYMNTPEVNPEGYRKSAPINFAEGLKGDLLIIHGTGETNTHIQITEGLVDRLVELGKQFDYMAYPNRNHGLREGKGTSLHLRTYMVRYWLNHLPPGPR
jgi:dipeptidyl-peptidase-4